MVLLKIDDFMQEKCVVESPVRVEANSAAKIALFMYKDEDDCESSFCITTPWMTNYGFNTYTDDSTPLTESVAFSLDRKENYADKFKEFLEDLDKWTIDTAHKNTLKWFGKDITPKFVPSDKTYMKFKMTEDVWFYTPEKRDSKLSNEEVKLYFTLGSKVRSIIRLNGFWIMDDKFGLLWEVLSVLVKQPSGEIDTIDDSISDSVEKTFYKNYTYDYNEIRQDIYEYKYDLNSL